MLTLLVLVLVLATSSCISTMQSIRITYTRSPLEDSRLFGPSPWKILATTYEQNENNISEQPSPWRNSSTRESCYGDRVYTDQEGRRNRTEPNRFLPDYLTISYNPPENQI